MSRTPRVVALLIFFVLLPLGLGAILAPHLVPVPEVGVIRIWFDIYTPTAQVIIDQLDYALQHRPVRAVVLIIDSPGGEVTASEDLYYSILDARQEMPVVASVDVLAASGAYYLAVATDEIYAKPTSLVGNVGVIGYAAPAPYVMEEILTTGPYKAFGGTQAGQVRQMEIAKEGFLRAVAAGRGDRLKTSLDFLSRGEAFSGVQALSLGLVDGLGSNQEAIARAAELAGIRDYAVVDLLPVTYPEEENPWAFRGETQWRQLEELPPGLYFRYIEPHP
jgi:protease-4